MPAVTENFAAGLSVEVGQIARELKKLWDAGDGVMTRASLINLAVYSEAPDSLGITILLVEQNGRSFCTIAAPRCGPTRK